jgi:hypothetical protein
VSTSRYVAGGYFLSCPREPADPAARLARAVTLGEDHSPRCFYPDSEFLHWTSQAPGALEELAATFHLDADGLAAACDWADEHFNLDFGAWTVIHELETARTLASGFLSGCPSLELWGIGLEDSLAERFVEQTRPPPAKPGFSPIGAGGVHRMVAQRLPLDEAGEELGHEVLCCLHGTSMQSLQSLHLDETALLAEVGVRPNRHGLIDELADAARVAAAAPLPPAPPGRSPASWLPWLLVRYPWR